MSEQTIRLFTQGALNLTAQPPLALYIHLPWCIRKCPYCDFNSHVGGSSVSGSNNKIIGIGRASSLPAAESLPFAAYVDALIADLDMQLPRVWGRRLWSIFMGGGTPSLFPPEQIERLLSAINARFGPPLSGEITMEANPGTFEIERFRGFRKAGVNRLSIGVQTFDDALLASIGRVHDGAQARAAIACAAETFDTFNIDLMYALPGQTLAQAESDIDTALSFSPPHLSLYQLTIEPETAFAVKPPVLPEEDVQADIEDLVRRKAAQAGLQRYEVSAFAKSGHLCRHNLNYWQFGDYLGIGAGAHAKLSFPGQVIREVRMRQPLAYMDAVAQGKAVIESRNLKAADLPFEFALNALRLTEGVPLQWYVERCGRPLADLQPALEEGRKRGLLAQGENLKATETGMRFLNDAQALFLP